MKSWPWSIINDPVQSEVVFGQKRSISCNISHRCESGLTSGQMVLGIGFTDMKLELVPCPTKDRTTSEKPVVVWLHSFRQPPQSIQKPRIASPRHNAATLCSKVYPCHIEGACIVPRVIRILACDLNESGAFKLGCSNFQ